MQHSGTAFALYAHNPGFDSFYKNNIKKLIQIGRLIVVKSTISILFETSHVKVTINFYNILSEIQGVILYNIEAQWHVCLMNPSSQEAQASLVYIDIEHPDELGLQLSHINNLMIHLKALKNKNKHPERVDRKT